MQLIRSDSTTFTFVEATESVSALIKRTDLVEKAKNWSQTHDCKYASATINGSEIKVIFSKESGYPLGEAAKDFLGTKEKYIWTEPTEDRTGFIFVAIDKGVTVKDTVLDADAEIDPFFMVQFIGEDKTAKVIYSGELPAQLLQYFASEEIEIVEDERDYLIFNKLAPSKSIECVDIEIAIDQVAFGSDKGISKVSIVIFVAIVGGIFLWVFDSNKESVARVFDPYVNYRSTMRNPSATAQLQTIHDALLVAETSHSWDFKKCDIGSGPLVCELTPGVSSRTSDLDDLVSQSGFGAKYYLVGKIAHFVVPISPPSFKRPDGIVSKDETLNVLFDQLSSIFEPDEIKILDSVNNNGWSTQNISVVKRDTGLHALALLAQATNGLPVNFVGAEVNKNAFLFSFEVEIQVIGTN